MVDFMASWMSTHSEALSALSDKLDRLQGVLVTYESTIDSDCDKIREVSVPRYYSDETQKHHRKLKASAALEGMRCQSTLQWPKVKDMLAEANVLPGDDYIMEAGDLVQPLTMPSFTSPCSHDNLSVEVVKAEYGAFLEHIYERHPILN